MGNKDRVRHSQKRRAVHTKAEKRRARRLEKQEHKSSKRKRRDAAAHQRSQG